jgi:hypothetical protein
VTKDEFARRFGEALEVAAANAEARFRRPIPRNFRIELHGANHIRDLMEPAAAVDALYLDEDRFYVIIDLAVLGVGPSWTTVFTRVSGHAPGPWEKTWNDPPGSGPFKQLLSAELREESE